MLAEDLRINFTVHFAMRSAISQDNVTQVKSIMSRYPEYSPETFPEGGYSPLHHSCSVGAVNTLLYFLNECNADINSRCSPYSITPALVAALNGNIEILKILHNKHANLHLADEFNENVLHKAVMKGDVSVLKYLIENCGLESLLIARDDSNMTPLDFFLHMKERGIHPKYLTEEENYEETLNEIFEYLRRETESVVVWSCRKKLIYLINQNMFQLF
jgi:hypothetical protein